MESFILLPTYVYIKIKEPYYIINIITLPNHTNLQRYYVLVVVEGFAHSYFVRRTLHPPDVTQL